MTVIMIPADCIEFSAKEALAVGCTFCGKGLICPFVHYNLGRDVFMCARCCLDGEGILLDIHKVKRNVFDIRNPAVRHHRPDMIAASRPVLVRKPA